MINKIQRELQRTVNTIRAEMENGNDVTVRELNKTLSERMNFCNAIGLVVKVEKFVVTVTEK